MIIVRAWLGLLAMQAIGAATLTLLCTQLSRWTLVAKLGLSFGLGLVTLSLTLFVASLAGATPTWWFGALEASILLVVILVFRRARLVAWLHGTAASPACSTRPWVCAFEVALVSVLTVSWTLLAAVSLVEPLVEGDVIAIWALKAKVLLHEPALTTPYFHDVSKAYSHLDYPLAWPLTMAWLWACAGAEDLQAVKALAPALLLALGALFFGLVRSRVDRANALLFTAFLMGVPMVLSQTSRLMADAPLAFFVLAAFGCAYRWLDAGHVDDLRLAGVFAAGMIFTKREGTALFAVLLVVLMLALVAERALARSKPVALWLIAVPLAAMAPWFVCLRDIPRVHDNYLPYLRPEFFARNVARVPEVLAGALRYGGNAQDWLAFWPLIGVAVAISVRHWSGRPVRFLVWSLASILCVYGTIYVVTPSDVAWLLETAGSRLLLHVAPLATLLLVELARVAGWLGALGPVGPAVSAERSNVST